MSEVAPIVRRPVKVDPLTKYYELGIRSHGKGTFHKPAIDGFSLGNKRVFLIKPGDLLFNNVFAWEGAVTIVKKEDVDRIGSHRFISCVPKKGVITTNFLNFHFSTSEGLVQLQKRLQVVQEEIEH